MFLKFKKQHMFLNFFKTTHVFKTKRHWNIQILNKIIMLSYRQTSYVIQNGPSIYVILTMNIVR